MQFSKVYFTNANSLKIAQNILHLANTISLCVFAPPNETLHSEPLRKGNGCNHSYRIVHFPLIIDRIDRWWKKGQAAN